MTPKEKAEELVDKLYQTTPNESWYNPPLGSLSIEYKAWEQSKQCALIAVDEIYKLRMTHGQHLEYDLDKINYYSYWEEVKQEIDKL